MGSKRFKLFQFDFKNQRYGICWRLFVSILAGRIEKNINDIQNLVVPHHACELDTSDEGVLNLKTNCSNGKAIICSGYNTYSHPNNDHINLLKQKFLFVETTGGAANSNKFERININ